MADFESMSVAELAQLVGRDPVHLAAFAREYQGPGDAASVLQELIDGEDPVADTLDVAALKRLAFSRPDPEILEKQREAAQRLADLDVERRAREASARRGLIAALRQTPDPLPRPAPRIGALGVLSIALLGIIGVTIASLLAPYPSLSVFDRSQDAEDIAAAESVDAFLGLHDVPAESVRLLASDGDVVFIAFQAATPPLSEELEPAVCLFVGTMDDGGGVSTCGTRASFLETGFSATVTFSDGRRYSYTWGPMGAIEYNSEPRYGD